MFPEPRGRQSFSYDDVSWETNGVVDFERIARSSQARLRRSFTLFDSDASARDTLPGPLA